MNRFNVVSFVEKETQKKKHQSRRDWQGMEKIKKSKVIESGLS